MRSPSSIFLMLCVLLALLPACEPRTPELVEVFDLMPAEVETHDTLTLRGSGFPPGEKAFIELEGSLYTAGEEPHEDFEATLLARSDTEERISLTFDKELVAEFTSSAEPPRHTTFRGSATVSFAPNMKGAPPIRGSADVVLDVYPPRELSEEDTERRVAEFLGAELSRSPHGVRVAAVIPDGRLSRAGVLQDDRIQSFAGVNTRTPLDLLPYAGQRVATLSVLRGSVKSDAPPLSLDLDVKGFEPQRADKWGTGLAVLGAMALWLLLFATRFGTALGHLLSRLAVQPRREPHAWFARRSAPVDRVPRGFAAFLGVSALFALVRLGVVPGVGDFDLPLLVLTIVTLELMLAILAGGHDGRRWSLFRALKALLACLPVQLAIVFCLVGVVLERGSLGLLALSEAQGAWPWEFQAFSSVSCFLGTVILIGTAVLRSLAPMPASRRLPRPPLVVEFLKTTSALLLLGLASALFLGGWVVPSSWGQSGALASATWFQFKLTLAYTVVLIAPRLLVGVESRHLAGSHARAALPLALLAAILAPVWLAEVWPDWLKEALTSALQLTTLFVLACLVVFVRHRKRIVFNGVNPWI